MERKAWRLTLGEMKQWVEGILRQGKRVIAPVEGDTLRLFQLITSGEDVSFAPGKTQWSPKEFLFPRTEALFSYSYQEDGVGLEDAPMQEREQVLFGVRPCDAAGLVRLDAIFREGEVDPLYERRRSLATIVSLACNEAGPECFCTAVDGSPMGEEGSDLQVVPMGGDWLVQPLTPKGEALAAPWAGGWKPASAEDRARAEAQGKQVAQGIARKPLSREWAATLEGSFPNPLWDDIGQRCLGCSICTYICPSCSCFDVQDEGNAWCGVRCRSWDSCTFALFTRHASGHNPRPNQASRYRQRVLHKFAYFPLQHAQRLMCVGCGRCLKLCPAGMDIHATVQTVVSASQRG